MTLELQIEPRHESAAATRSADKVPAIVYGPKQKPVAIAVDRVTFHKALEQAGESTILSLIGLAESIEVLIHDVAFNAAKGGVEHVDFYAIERGKELTTHVPITFIGEAPAEKIGLIVNRSLFEVEVTCKPSMLPSHFDVDLSVLVDVESKIHVSDLAVPTGVTIETEVESTIASVAAAHEEVDAETPMDIAEVAVEKKGKAIEEPVA